MATHSSILAGKIPWTEKPGRLQSIVCKESDTTELLNTRFYLRLYSYLDIICRAVLNSLRY